MSHHGREYEDDARCACSREGMDVRSNGCVLHGPQARTTPANPGARILPPLDVERRQRPAVYPREARLKHDFKPAIRAGLKAAKGGSKLDAGKPALWLVPFEAIEHRVPEDCKALATALVAWVRRDPNAQSYLRAALRPEVVAEAATVLEFGAEKYAAWNWEKGLSFTRVAAAGLRHAIRFPNGEDLDPESGKPHRAHLACNAIFALTLDLRGAGGEWDDRPEGITP